MPPKLKARVTNKMLEVLTPPELRMLCLLLGMPVILSWKASPKERLAWFIEHLTQFVEIDLEKENWSLYRKPTKDYCLALQAFASGDGPAPVFNALLDYGEEAKPIKYEEPPVWTRTEDEAAEEEQEEIEEELKQREQEAATKEPAAEVKKTETITENKPMSDTGNTKRFALKKTSLGNKPAPEPVIEKSAEPPAETAVEQVLATEATAEEKAAVKKTALPAVRAVRENDSADDKLQKIGDLVEKLCQIVTRQNKELTALREAVEMARLRFAESQPEVAKKLDIQDKAMLILLNNTVLSDTPLDKLEDILEV